MRRTSLFSIDIVCAIVYDVNSEGDEALTQKEKLLRKMKSSPQDVGFDDLHKYLIQNGATARHGKGSHWVYSLKGQHLAIPRDNPVKAIYVKLAFAMVEGEARDEKDSG